MRSLIRSSSFIYSLAAFFSIIISLVLFKQTWVVNNDAVCYLQTASTLYQGLHAAMDVCGQAKTPFYSILIALMGKMSSFTYLNAAYLLNGCFSVMTVLIFISIIGILSQDIKEQSNQIRLLWLGAFVILCSHEFNVVRSLIIRDHGYWAFYLLSVLFLLQYFRHTKWYYAVLWSLSMIVATLFRVEGFIFLILMPFCVLFYKQLTLHSRLLSFIQLNLLTILLFSAAAAWFLFHPEQLHSYKRYNELSFQLFHGITFLSQRYYWQGNALIDHVLGHGTPYNGAYLLFITLSVWYVTLLIIHLSYVYSFLIGYAWWHKLLPKQPVLKSYILINLMITLIFLGENMFVSRRYLMALSITFMFWIPFALNELMQKWRTRKWLSMLVLIGLLISAVGGLIDFGHSKKYLYDAGQWIALNIAKNNSIYSNDLQLMFYSQHFNNDIFAKGKEYTDLGIKKLLLHDQWKEYDYLVLKITQKEINKNFKVYKYLKKWQPIQVFKNKHNDQVLIFEIAPLRDQANLEQFLSLLPTDATYVKERLLMKAEQSKMYLNMTQKMV